MANPYFRNIPDFEYVSRAPEPQNISDYTTVKNLFKRGKLREEIFGNLNFFTKYNIIGDERPDNVASKIYNDETLDWVILLSNNILNIRTEWPMPQRAFDRFLIGKYRIGNEEEEETYNRIYGGGGSINSFGFTATIVGSAATYTGVTGRTSGDGVGAKFNIKRNSSGEIISIDVVKSGTRYAVGDTITILGSNVGGVDGTDDVTITVTKLVGIHHYESPEIRNSQGITILKKGLTIPQNFSVSYYDSLLDINVTKSNIAIPITNFEFEEKIQNKKRNIFILKPIYLNVVYNDLDSIMPYKQGSEQYVSRTLKRGDNIRLYQ
jgi:hypothetical protein